jgi:TetR/AcrR family transcriptional regulator, tetracycline repressor protein
VGHGSAWAIHLGLHCCPIATRPGPPRKLTEDDVLDAALSLLAEHGLVGLNLRAVAARLDASPGTLYNYFDNKQALLEAALARALQPVARVGVRTADWRTDLRATIVALYEAFFAHPSAVTLLNAGVGAERMDNIREHILGLLAEAGLPIPERMQAQNMLVALAVGDVIVHGAHTREHRAAEWGRRRALPPERFPNLTEVARGDFDERGNESFLLGLDALLVAIAAMRRNQL